MFNLPPEFLKNTSYKIKTPNGYENFYGVNKITEPEYIHLKFTNGQELKCSLRHPIMTPEGMVRAQNLTKQIEIITEDGLGCFVTSKRIIKRKIDLYDIVNSGIDNTYFTNGILSHNCEFLGSSNTLISGSKLQQLVSFQKPAQMKRNEVNIHHVPIKEKWDLKGDEEKQLEIEHHYVILVDTSEGKKQDYSAFVVVDITELPYKIVATYHDNTISPLLYPTILWNCAKYYNEAMILIEAQSAGAQVADILHIELEYERLLRTYSGNKRAQQISEGHIPGAQLGVKMTRPIKDIGCLNLKTMVETDQLIINDMDVISELTTFVLNGKGTYEADDNASDDLAMCLVLFGWLTTQTYFKDLVQHDLRKLLKQASMDFDDQDALPSFAVVDHQTVELIRIGDDFWSDSGFEASFLDPYNHYWTDFKQRL